MFSQRLKSYQNAATRSDDLLWSGADKYKNYHLLEVHGSYRANNITMQADKTGRMIPHIDGKPIFKVRSGTSLYNEHLKGYEDIIGYPYKIWTKSQIREFEDYLVFQHN